MEAAATEDKLIFALSTLPNRCTVLSTASVSDGGVYHYAALPDEWQAAASSIVAAFARIYGKRGETTRAAAQLADTLVESRTMRQCKAVDVGFHLAENTVGLHVSLPPDVAPRLEACGGSSDVLFIRPRRIHCLSNSRLADAAMFTPGLHWAMRYALVVDVFADEDCTIPVPIDFPHVSIAFLGVHAPKSRK